MIVGNKQQDAMDIKAQSCKDVKQKIDGEDTNHRIKCPKALISTP